MGPRKAGRGRERIGRRCPPSDGEELGAWWGEAGLMLESFDNNNNKMVIVTI